MHYLDKFCILLFFLHFNEFTLAFMPTKVWGHNAILADSKIYFTGGFISSNSISKEFYYLDVKNPFNVREGSLPWVDLSSVSQILPTHSWSALSLCGTNNDTLVMFGGDFGTAPVDPTRLVYTYEIQSQLWSNPLTLNQPKNKHSRSVCNMRTGKMYMFGGFSEPLLNNMDILNTQTLEWTISNSVYAPGGRFDYTATLLSNGIIVYIGGVSDVGGGVPVDMSKLPLYNINDDSWSIMSAPGYLPTPHGHHSAVLTKDGRIIVYGGYINHNTLVPVSDDLVVLDTAQAIFTWSKASVSTTSPLSRSYHSATLVGDYMIVAFGRNNIFTPSPETNEVFILDTSSKSDYKWVNEFIPPVTSSDPSTPTPSTSTPSDSSNVNRGLIIGIVVVLLILVGGLFLIYLFTKRHQSRQNVLLMLGN